MARAHPGGVGDLTADEELIVAAIEAGSYFIENETPSGTKNGVNVTFTLAGTPNPASSLRLTFNGQRLASGGVDFTLSGDTITYVLAPVSDDILLADYRVDPT